MLSSSSGIEQYFFTLQRKWCYHANISSFISFFLPLALLFARILLQITHTGVNLSVFFEIFLFHQITLNKIASFLEHNETMLLLLV